MRIETERLVITEFTPDMAQAVHENSLDEDNRRFVPDEVFETVEEAAETIAFLMSRYGGKEGPLVYPVVMKAGGENIGYVQMAPLEDGTWEIGYHIAKKYTGRGCATEAVKAFLPVMAKELDLREIQGVCLSENAASKHVLLKCGFRPVFEGAGDYQGEKREVFRSVWKTLPAEGYVCTVPSLEEVNRKWDYEIAIHPDDRNWSIWKKGAVEGYLEGRSLLYYGILDGNIICEATAIRDPDFCGKKAESTIELCAFRTNKEYRGMGYFSKLKDFMLQDLKQRGYTRAVVGVEPEEEGNKAIYHHWGFTEPFCTGSESYPDGTVIQVEFYSKLL